jgi:site-specific recombinase XerD
MEILNTIVFDSYMENLIRDFALNGKKSSAETYDSALKRLHQCFGEQSILLSDIERSWVLKFRDYLIESGLSMNSVNTYLGVMRNVYRRVIITYNLKQLGHPFEKVFLTVRRPPREIPGIDLLNKIRQARLDNYEYLDFSRDLFLFSYYAGGMSFRDMALLKKKDIHHGRLHFIRSRSGCEQVVLLTEPIKAILQAYENRGVYLFPIIRHPDKDLYQQYRSGLRKYNLHIRKLADLLHIQVPLNTPMVFEHQEASAVKWNNASAKVSGNDPLLNRIHIH